MILARWRAALLGGAAALAFGSTATAAEANFASASWVSAPGNESNAYVEVTRLTPEQIRRYSQESASNAAWPELAFIYLFPRGAQPDTIIEAPGAMFARYTIANGVVRVTPQFPLQPGETYVARVVKSHQPGNQPGHEIEDTFLKVPERARTAPARISVVYPEVDVVPENLLKFYIQFSASMNGGSVYDHIHLRDASGKEDPMAFLKLGQELWDPTMTRLTLLMDPGRIKRGVSLNLELGPALEAGKNYSLTIDPDWKDSNGQPLAFGFIKSFRVGPSDRTAIDTAKWRVTAPKRASRDPLEIAFPEPLDHALAMRLIRVVDAKGANVLGDVATADQDRRWTFRPDADWPAGRFEIVVFTTIEDLAGNNVGKPFDVDVFENVQRELPSETVKLGFEIR